MQSDTTSVDFEKMLKPFAQQELSCPNTVRGKVACAFADAPVMIAVARCESRFRQYNADGTVLRGKENSKDLGVFQINEYWNGADAKRRGFDLKTTEGNIGYARVMYKEQGLKPWGASRSCWG